MQLLFEVLISLGSMLLKDLDSSLLVIFVIWALRFGSFDTKWPCFARHSADKIGGSFEVLCCY